ncbi:MAG: hypothetical protein J0M04_07565 [Verrucomicrobia bacterium]|nr:hypothetical protein [Verrucomicrobiota bacterium]
MKTLLALCASAALMPLVHAADPKNPEPFEDALREAVKEYRAGKLDKARAALDQAAALLDKHQTGKVADTFPDPPEGWIVGDVEKSNIPDYLGGGRTIKKTYREKAGKKEIVLEVIVDSSYAKLLVGLVSNDAIAESQGFEVKKIGGDRALLKGNELNLPVDERFLVKLTGKGGAEAKDLLAFARDVDRHALKKVE